MQQLNDRYAVTTAHARSLAELASRPTFYIQRIVEQLSFVTTGGQRWKRTLQVKLPASGEVQSRSWWIVPLGQFHLRRFADISVMDSSGARVSLLTRQQHGMALTKSALATHLFNLPDEARKQLKESEEAESDYRGLRSKLEQYFTVMTEDERDAFLSSAVTHYVSLLRLTKLSEKEVNERRGIFLDDFDNSSQTTKYLCWVMAEAGDVVNLQASYTVTDPEHKLKRKGFKGTAKSFAAAFSFRQNDARREVWSQWYRQFGLSPFNYEFKIPTQLHAGSYYFTLEAPSRSYVTYLDWQTSNSLHDEEIDCAYPSAHIHNEESSSVPQAEGGGTMRAYLRCIPHHHKQILGTAALNIALVWLLTTKEFAANISSPLAGVLVAAPSVLIAYLVRQQRHYYAHVMRRQRAILWGYLVVSLVFLIAVAFSISDDLLKATFLLEPSAWALAISSAAILGWYLPLGYGLDRSIEFLTEQKWNTVKSPSQTMSLTRINRVRYQLWWKRSSYKAIEERWQCYQEAVAQYCRWTLRLMGVMIVAMAFCMGLLWELPSRGEEANAASAQQHATTHSTSHPQPSPTHPTQAGNPQESRGP